METKREKNTVNIFTTNTRIYLFYNFIKGDQIIKLLFFFFIRFLRCQYFGMHTSSLNIDIFFLVQIVIFVNQF